MFRLYALCLVTTIPLPFCRCRYVNSVSIT